jgi:shikimate kinase
MKVFLIGYMASGKSRMGRELAECLGYGFIDLDDLFEEKYKITVLDFFEKYGEGHFRKIESDLLKEVIALDDTIISCGGGTPCFFDNMDMIKGNGVSIYLKMSVKELVARLAIFRKRRPLLKDKPVEELEEYICNQLRERELYYYRADVVVNSVSLSVTKLIELLSGR